MDIPAQSEQQTKEEQLLAETKRELAQMAAEEKLEQKQHSEWESEGGKPPETEQELVDPAVWYGELLQAGYKEEKIIKTGLTKMRLVKKEKRLDTTQDRTTNEMKIGDIELLNVYPNGEEHPSEKPYGFGDKSPGVTQAMRYQDFFRRYEPIAKMPGVFRKKNIVPVTGIKVPETKRFKVAWDTGGAELKVGGFLVKDSDGSFYPINPESMWAYDVLPYEEATPSTAPVSTPERV